MVESDLISVSGDERVLVPAKSKVPYEINVYPIMSGLHRGSIKFTDKNGRYQWY